MKVAADVQGAAAAVARTMARNPGRIYDLVVAVCWLGLERLGRDKIFVVLELGGNPYLAA